MCKSTQNIITVTVYWPPTSLLTNKQTAEMKLIYEEEHDAGSLSVSYVSGV